MVSPRLVAMLLLVRILKLLKDPPSPAAPASSAAAFCSPMEAFKRARPRELGSHSLAPPRRLSTGHIPRAATGGPDDGTAKHEEEEERDELAAAPAPRDWSALTFAALLEEVKVRGLPASGAKASLILRLEAHESGAPSPLPPSGPGDDGDEQQQQVVSEEPIKKYDSDLVVVLDLDQCLIDSHLSSAKETSEEFIERLLGNNWKKKRFINPELEHWRLPVTEKVEAYVTPRPGVREFLRNVTGRFETHAFTAAYKLYAGKVLDRLDPDDHLAGRWYAIYTVSFGSGSIKALNVIFPGRNLAWVVLVDDNKFSMLANPANGIWIPPFNGMDPLDNELEKVWELLLDLDDVPDVRPILDEKFGVAKEFASYLEMCGDEIQRISGTNREWAEWALKRGLHPL
jgi:NLI interacting factor-like phosphatase